MHHLDLCNSSGSQFTTALIYTKHRWTYWESKSTTGKYHWVRLRAKGHAPIIRGVSLELWRNGLDPRLHAYPKNNAAWDPVKVDLYTGIDLEHMSGPTVTMDLTDLVGAVAESGRLRPGGAAS